MPEFLRKYKNYLFLTAIILAVSIFSLTTLTTKPKLWTDESMSIELARNFLNYGRLNFMAAPGEFFDAPFLLQSTGYTMTAPLALFFKIFGFGLVQARFFALMLMLSCLILIYWLTKKFFGVSSAFWAVLLTATFAPFYANGRCVTGEITGFIFLLFGLYLLFEKEKFFWSGCLIGLAVVTKPSIYLYSLLAVLAVFLLSGRGFWRKTVKFSLGVAPAILLWLVLVLPNFWSAAGWVKIFNFYKNPFGAGSSPTQNIIANLQDWPLNATSIYFTILFLMILTAIFLDKKFFVWRKKLFVFLVVYVGLSFIYFLKSPGWLRYLLAAEILILMVLAPTLQILIDKLAAVKLGRFTDFFSARRQIFFSAAMIFLILIQLVHLLTKADIFYSDESIKIINLLNQQAPGKSIGFINSLDVASLVSTEKRYQFVDIMLGLPVLGQDFLTRPAAQLPEIIVAGADEKILKIHSDLLEKNYQLIYQGRYNIYKNIYAGN